MAAMDLDRQLSGTSRVTKEAETESELSPEAERSYAESELSLECDGRSPRSSREAERSREQVSGRGGAEPESSFYCGHGVFTQVDKLAEDEGLSGGTWGPSPASNVMFEVFAQVEKPSGTVVLTAKLVVPASTLIRCIIQEPAYIGCDRSRSRTLQADLNSLQQLHDDAHRRGAAALAKTKDFGRICKDARLGPQRSRDQKNRQGDPRVRNTRLARPESELSQAFKRLTPAKWVGVLAQWKELLQR
ncbi:hypothetical protein PHYSODRAFT_325773 [Phytophthora sojae]|uniref:Uncharacterized protein n=1 Tax=Phytophthora sojae (strain P6497) TaxID=1094619 RepID=G4Z165_PHYSP|nr:hypothetical protein PHYSODRAFT_325773 [Phytophthora sojae]EGZ24684.1 hypothetical protein PHYSODRAFT_325773 [Phytophthora sojae]|eukprot:XP_009519972.1 hypothetical protein PHYSODRAFT_325773 [Phytophthora sojae]